MSCIEEYVNDIKPLVAMLMNRNVVDNVIYS
jgi:hypothetical protein